MRKYASLEVLEAWRQTAPGTRGSSVRAFARTAHRVAFDYQPRPGYLYVRSRMISSRTNDNHDTFPAGEIEKGYRTFLGKPVFVNHHNANHRRARGVIVAVALHRDKNPDGTPDTWVEGLMEVDAVRFPKLAKAILAGRVNRTSMGVDVEWSRCSACGNKATSPAEYCNHLPAMKGKKIRRRNKVTGKLEEILIHEVCAGLSFFENSLLVEDPADPTAVVLDHPDARGLDMSPRTASPDRTYGSRRDSVPGGYVRQGKSATPLASPALARRDQWQEFVLDDQARQRVSDVLHRQFEQLSGRPLPRHPRGDEDRMPPDPFTASRTAAFTEDYTHCVNCGHPFAPSTDASRAGDWQNFGMPFLCNDCSAGYEASSTAGSKPPPVRYRNPGGTHPMESEDSYRPMGAEPFTVRPWTGHDMPIQSQSARKQRPKKARDRYPQPVRGHGSDPRFYGVALKRDRNGFYVHTHRARSDSYPTVDDIPEADIDYIRSTGAKKAEGGDHEWFRAHPVHAQHIIDSYHGSTEDERALGDRWYSDAHHVAKIMGKGDAALGAGVLSAYSVRTLWPVNLFNASRALRGDPPGPGTGAMGVHQKAALRIIGGEHHSKVLTAPKTAAFAHLIEHGGDSEEDKRNGTQRVVIDRHAMSVAVGHRLTDTEKEGMPIGQHQHYEHVAQAYRDAAAHLSRHYGREIAPHQVQATTWLHQIHKNTEEDASGQQGGGGKGRVQLGDNSRTRWQELRRQHHPEIPEHNLHYHGKRALAYRETRVPPQVDTLRMDECPVCGEHNVWSGSRCPVCGFVVPPSVFRDPDTSKAQQVRDQLDSSGDVTLPPDAPDGAQPGGLPPVAQMGSGEDADAQLFHPDQIAPDGVPTVQSGGDADFDAQDDGMVPPGDEELAANDPGADAEMQEDEAEEETADGAVPMEDEEDPGEEMYAEELVCPACGTTFEADAAAQPGVPCPACGMAALHPADEDEAAAEEEEGEEAGGEEDPGDPRKEQEDPSDPDEQPGDEEDEEDEDKDMPESKTAAAVARAQARRIAELTARNEVLEAQLRFLASAAGVDREFAEINRQVMQRHADILNPASPVPDPPQGPPTETTEQALMPESMDNAGRPGTTPGANSRVPAAQTTTAITPGVEMQTPPATNLIDVTAPVQGTNPSQDGGVPIEQRRIETDVRIDPDPLKAHGPGIGGQGNDGTAFPWILDARKPENDPAQRTAAVNGEADASRRTFASIRLAKLRITAGLAQGEELSVAERIERDAALSTPMIEHEIGTLEQVGRNIPRGPQRPVQRTAARQVPSLASVGAAQYASAASYGEDDASDLFD